MAAVAMRGISTIQLTSRLRNIVPPSVQTSAERSPVLRVEELDDAAQAREWLRFDVPSRSCSDRIGVAAAARVEPPRGQPSADVAAAGDRGQVVELVEHAGARQALEHAEAEAATAHATTRQAERRMAGLRRAAAGSPRASVGGRLRRDLRVHCRVQERILVREHAIDGQRRRLVLGHGPISARVVRAATRSRVVCPSVNQP